MKLLVDSHILLWWLESGSRLADDIQAVFLEPASRLVVSTATVWELSIKAGLGKLRIDWDIFRFELDFQDMEVLPVSVEHGIAAGNLPFHHGDPFDRMLVAQALTEGLMLVTRDRALQPYDVPILWA